MADPPLLDLSTLIDRASISIDGVRYELRSPNELSILGSHSLGVWGRRIEVLSGSEDIDDAAELEALIDKVVQAVVVDLPEDVHRRLSGAARQGIVDVFTGLLLRRKLGVAEAMATAMGQPIKDQPIGAQSFPGSSGSMVVTPTGGWRVRLARWFGRS